jgi:hypothetical protein
MASMGLLSHTHSLEKACEIINNGHISHMFYDRKLFALENITHELCDELCVIQIIAYS